eukprot:5396050-Pyramimonas_sp.AAC.1
MALLHQPSQTDLRTRSTHTRAHALMSNTHVPSTLARALNHNFTLDGKEPAQNKETQLVLL